MGQRRARGRKQPDGDGVNDKNDRMDIVLNDWAVWYQTKALFWGFGAGVDRKDLIERGIWGGKRGPGTHSDPTFSEVLSIIRDHQSRQARVHIHLCRYPLAWQDVTRARYTGFIQPKTQVEGEPHAPGFEWGYRWTWEAIETGMGIPQSTAKSHLRSVKKCLRADIQLDHLIRIGKLGHDTGIQRAA